MSTELSSLFRLILVRGQTCSAMQQTRRLSDSDLMAKTDDIVLRLKRKTKTDRAHTLKLLEKYFHDDEPFRNERGISMTMREFQEHVKFYVKGRQTFRAAQIKQRHAHRHEQDLLDLQGTTEAWNYAKRWADFVQCRHSSYLVAQRAREEVYDEVCVVLNGLDEDKV